MLQQRLVGHRAQHGLHFDEQTPQLVRGTASVVGCRALEIGHRQLKALEHNGSGSSHRDEMRKGARLGADPGRKCCWEWYLSGHIVSGVCGGSTSPGDPAWNVRGEHPDLLTGDLTHKTRRRRRSSRLLGGDELICE